MGEAAAEIDVDALLDEVKAPAPEREMGGGAATPDPAATGAKEESPWWGSVEFDWNGKKVKPDSEEKARTWMSQGYNYSQRVGELNKQKASWDAERQQLIEARDKLSKYAELDDYAAKNPEWKDHLYKTWEQRQTLGVDPNIAQVLNPINERLAKFEQFVGTFEEQQKQQEIKQADDALEQEIGSIRKSHPNIDFGARDETGKTLENRILMHANQIGTSSFRAAMRDYLHDHLVTNAQANGREAIAKDTQMKAKKGILGQTPTPMKELKSVNTKAPWNDAQFKGENILKEMGLI